MKLSCIFARSLPVFALSALATATGCAVEADPAATEETETLVDESSDALTASGASNFGYFIVTRRDTRRCVSPLCGGFFVKRVNEKATLCADGSRQAECYVSSIQLNGIGLSEREESEFRGAVETGKALVKARTYKTKFGATTLGVLKANEGWLGLTGAKTDDSSFYRAADNGVRCITAPCPSMTAYGLNGAADYNVVDVRLDATGADERTLDRARHSLWTKDGLLVGGNVALPKCRPDTSCGPILIPSELYVRVERTEGKSCGGRSAARVTCGEGQSCFWAEGAICGRADAHGSCGFRPEACIEIFKPVCGCDLVTYGNSCQARAAGTSVLSPGECPTSEAEAN